MKEPTIRLEVDEQGKRWRVTPDEEWRDGQGRGGKVWWRFAAGELPDEVEARCGICDDPVTARFVLVGCVFGSWKGGGEGLVLDVVCALELAGIVAAGGYPVKTFGWATIRPR